MEDDEAAGVVGGGGDSEEADGVFEGFEVVGGVVDGCVDAEDVEAFEVGGGGVFDDDVDGLFEDATGDGGEAWSVVEDAAMRFEHAFAGRVGQEVAFIGHAEGND